MSKKVITSRPISENSVGYLVLEDENRKFSKFLLSKDMPLTISIDNPEVRRCTGWYDILTHTHHPCEKNCVVDSRYDACYECRQKTDFNPAFYNTTNISTAQTKYNEQPHSVYIAYFGGGIAKSGMTADSRGLQRLYEQGALLYYLVGSFDDATKAHNVEDKLIHEGLLNSVTKRQKERILTNTMDIDREEQSFSKILNELGYNKANIVCNLEHFFYGQRPTEQIIAIGDRPISGQVRGIIGRYLVLQNNGALYGFWLSKLHGYSIEITDEIQDIKPEPQQISLFG